MKSQKEIRTKTTIDLAMRIIANGRSGVYKEASRLFDSLRSSLHPEKVIQDCLFGKFNEQRSAELANAKDASAVAEIIFGWITKFGIPGDVDPDELAALLKEIDDKCETINHGICFRLNHHGSGRNDRLQAQSGKNSDANRTLKFKES